MKESFYYIFNVCRSCKYLVDMMQHYIEATIHVIVDSCIIGYEAKVDLKTWMSSSFLCFMR